MSRSEPILKNSRMTVRSSQPAERSVRTDKRAIRGMVGVTDAHQVGRFVVTLLAHDRRTTIVDRAPAA
jgi:hypothetical protein